ncbi:ABC transporter substrate-binding protein [Mesorhizobium sp.]|uniref:ABC transporter substrate-binding protein n=1 Tax=Mesorhizobium sp. TaxID=1871066 RepID=UPI001218170D|nr:ABC transporter substrate-binding protein [Mesorhizobium sp.]TIO05975.1 MAG: ABC transporter substrate-binding protein [Mesorhizobium sp.]TIO31341.1 MAG: ABC transporter substrate-binding protein [Mesorhizobium sp.]TIP12980.1 MAG: ABC transporter substrate-binding protein [Mesorhizobium sp.]
MRATIAGTALATLVMPCCAPALATEPPKRVVSMNLCTDQMAMLIAGPGQLYSVSYLAGDQSSSVLASQASGYVVNHGLAEEIFLMQPDLVIAGTYTTRTTVALLRRLGFRVEEFAPESSFDDVRANLRRMGDILQRQRRAAELVAELDAGLAKLAANAVPGKTVALYYANSYTSGSGTLADAIVKASGLTNIDDTLGLAGTVRLPLELLLVANPDLIVADDSRDEAPALAQENFVHPAYKALSGQKIAVPGKYTICGAPFTLEAARMLQDAARKSDGATP